MINNEKQVSFDKGMLKLKLGSYQSLVEDHKKQMTQDQVIQRIWKHDHTLWNPQPSEIEDRLGWLNTIGSIRASLPEITSAVDNLRKQGYTHALLLGMGGSSLAPELFSQTFATEKNYLIVSILDSTDPYSVQASKNWIEDDLQNTIIIVSTKSGTTVETLSFLKFFYNIFVKVFGKDKAGEHFIAITDGGSELADLALAHHFRNIFFNDPNIGGRYSALSFFGLIPAALMGINLDTLLLRAQNMVNNNRLDTDAASKDNFALNLGATLGACSNIGRDKLTYFISPQIASFGDWVEQLIAESTGKEEKGIIPIIAEPNIESDKYGDDRLFVNIKIDADETYTNKLKQLEVQGHPVITISIQDQYDLGGQFFLWEMSTAIAGHILGINPFDQPNVETAKRLARQMVETYQKEGKLPEATPLFRAADISVYSSHGGKTISESLDNLLPNSQPGYYLAIQAYIQATPETTARLNKLRMLLGNTYNIPTTIGYGPRYLHSTGQLHKGGSPKGIYLQITSQTQFDLDIPDSLGEDQSSLTFGTLIRAQAQGDYQALLDAERKVLRYHIHGDRLIGLDTLIAAWENR